mmetsp:Transcript_7857/g.19500  ORF Transcript_7857/g.19500 Transcript_7857/m.19500 type:complete len:228 (+) Transcript_7857:225-908(+)
MVHRSHHRMRRERNFGGRCRHRERGPIRRNAQSAHPHNLPLQAAVGGEAFQLDAHDGPPGRPVREEIGSRPAPRRVDVFQPRFRRRHDVRGNEFPHGTRRPEGGRFERPRGELRGLSQEGVRQVRRARGPPPQEGECDDGRGGRSASIVGVSRSHPIGKRQSRGNGDEEPCHGDAVSPWTDARGGGRWRPEGCRGERASGRGDTVGIVEREFAAGAGIGRSELGQGT